jgi:heme oxygenase
MHAHPGFHAAAAGVIEVHDYRRLLSRLLGFHRPFERLIRAAAARHGVDLDFDSRARSPFLVQDLMSLGLGRGDIERLPDWAPSLDLTSEGAVLGSLYVLEGSSLGGLQIGRSLKGRFSGESDEGRRFFLGRGDRHGALWGEFVARLETLAGRPQSCDEAVAASLATFSAFERWMAGWTIQPAAL